MCEFSIRRIYGELDLDEWSWSFDSYWCVRCWPVLSSVVEALSAIMLPCDASPLVRAAVTGPWIIPRRSASSSCRGGRHVRAAPLVRVKPNSQPLPPSAGRLGYTVNLASTRAMQSENAVCEESSATVYGSLDWEFDFDSHEWSCSKIYVFFGSCSRRTL